MCLKSKKILQSFFIQTFRRWPHERQGASCQQLQILHSPAQRIWGERLACRPPLRTWTPEPSRSFGRFRVPPRPFQPAEPRGGAKSSSKCLAYHRTATYLLWTKARVANHRAFYTGLSNSGKVGFSLEKTQHENVCNKHFRYTLWT